MAPGLARSVSEVTRQELKEHPTGVVAGDKVGQGGVESAFDAYLRGVPGSDQLRVDSLGRPIGPVAHAAQSIPGSAVRLTLDMHLQRAAQQALAYGIQLARQ